MRRPYRQFLLPLLLCLLWHPAPAVALAEQGAPAPEALRLEVKAGKTRLYLGERVPLTVTLLAAKLQLRDIQYPRIGGSSFALGRFGLPAERETLRDGNPFAAYDFTTTLTAKRSGTLPLGPVELQCDLLVPAGGSAAFFGGTESRRLTVASQPFPLTVLPIPARGRPEGFGGAVGRFTVSVSATPRELQAGDPVTVRTVIRGEGSLEHVSCTPITAPGFTGYPPKATLAGNTLSCEQVLIPQTRGVREVPAVAISFFDPVQEQFQTVRSAPVPLRVTLPAIPAASAPPAPPRPSAQHPPSSPSLPFAPWPVAGFALLSLAAGLAGMRLAARYRDRKAAPPPAADVPPGAGEQQFVAAAEAALAAGDAEAFYRAAFRATQAVTAARLRVPAAGWAGPLPEELLPAELHALACAMLKRCDQVRYGRDGADPAQMALDLRILRQFLAHTPS